MASIPSIPYLFVDREQVLSTKAWKDHLHAKASQYENCFVKSITHVKNLGSIVSHEYLQVIIEDEDTQFRTRLIVERQTEQDQVIIGRWTASKWTPRSSRFLDDMLSSSSSSSSDTNPVTVYPLPLASLKFEGADQIRVVDLASTLYQTTRLQPDYSLAFANCYWFASTVYGVCREVSSSIREKLWTFHWVRGLPLFWRRQYMGEANNFEAGCQESMEYQPNGDSEPRCILNGMWKESSARDFENWIGGDWAFRGIEPDHDTPTDAELASSRRKFDNSIDAVCNEIRQNLPLGLVMDASEQANPEESMSWLVPYDPDTHNLPPDVEVFNISAEQARKLSDVMNASVMFILSTLRVACAMDPEDCIDMDPLELTSDTGCLAVARTWLWEVGQTLRIRFIDGTAEEREKVKKYAKQWTKWANLTMEFVDDNYAGDTDIRVAFDTSKPTCSKLGKSARTIAQNEPTMNFSNLVAEGYKGTILHEFGHALGCLHEHLSPAAGILWDKAAVYRQYRNQKKPWSEATIHSQVLNHYTNAQVEEGDIRNSSLDGRSVMIYSIEPWMTTNGVSFKQGQELSRMDKHFIAAIYPHPTDTPKGHNLNVLDENWGFPLYWASAWGQAHEVRRLLRAGADPNFQSGFQWRALHWAAGNGHVDVVDHLLDWGALVDVRSDTGMTPLDLARINGNQTIIEELEEHAEIQARAAAELVPPAGTEPATHHNADLPLQPIAVA